MIAIVGAMEEEVSAILKYLEQSKQTIFQHIVFHEGIMNGKSVVVFQSGVGLVMAAMTLTCCLDHYAVTHIINVGTAGGLHSNQKILDLVIPDRLTYHDMDITPFGNERNFGPQNRFVFTTDKELIERFKPLISHERVWYGPLVSGNQFVSTEDQFKSIKNHYPEAEACEMEGAALAHVANEFNTPIIILRSLSDIVLHQDNSVSFSEYLQKASTRSAILCHDFVGLISI